MLHTSDPHAAREWMEQAAAAGRTDASYAFGLLLISNDPQAARDWLEQAAAAGHPGASQALALLPEDTDS